MTGSRWSLPCSIAVAGEELPIETDYRVALDALAAFVNPDLEPDEKWLAALDLLFKGGLEAIPPGGLEDAVKGARDYLDARGEGLGSPRKRGGMSDPPVLMDWEQDAPLYFPAVNRILGYEVRGPRETHWWTFYGAYLEIQDGLFSTVVALRSKIARHEKLDKWEERFKAENKDLVQIKKRRSAKEQALYDYYNSLLD